MLQTSIHEYLHTEEHPRYIAYRNSLVYGTHAYNTLVEGVVSLLTEIVWFGISFAKLRRLVEGEYASLLELPPEMMPRGSAATVSVDGAGDKAPARGR